MACTKPVWLVTLHFMLCSLPWSASPGCSSSWPVWTRRTVYSFMAVACARRVLLVTLHLALFSFPRFAGPWFSASRPAWTGRQLLWHVKAGYAGYDAPHAVVFFLVRRPMMLDIIAGIRRTVVVACTGWLCRFRCTSRSVRSSGSQAHDARHHGRYGPEGDFSRSSSFPVVTQRFFHMVQIVRRTIEIPSCTFIR